MSGKLPIRPLPKNGSDSELQTDKNLVGAAGVLLLAVALGVGWVIIGIWIGGGR